VSKASASPSSDEAADWSCPCGRRCDANDVFCGTCGERRGPRVLSGEWGCTDCGRLCAPDEGACESCGGTRQSGFASKTTRDAFLKKAEANDESVLRAVAKHFAEIDRLIYDDDEFGYKTIPLFTDDEEKPVAPSEPD
jgi:hypothetical protein